MKRARDTTVFDDIGFFIAQGTYAFVYGSVAEPDEYVYRIELVEFLDDVRHQNKVQDILVRQELGPCFPKVSLCVFVALGEFPPSCQRSRLNRRAGKWGLDLDKAKVCITKIERGKRTLCDFSFSSPQVADNILFMLLWSVWNANVVLGFRHRDIKGENVVIKELPAPITLAFQVGETRYALQTRYIPLLVDYGFASVYGSSQEQRHLVGTISAAPPEVIAHGLMYDGHGVSVFHNGLFSEDAYDCWSIALSVLLRRLRVSSIFKVGGDSVEALTRGSDETRARYEAFYRICLLQKALGNGIAPPAALIGKYYPRHLFTRKLKRRLGEIRYNIDTKRLQIFRQLLAWDPRERVRHGNVFEVFPALVEEGDGEVVYHANKLKLRDFDA